MTMQKQINDDLKAAMKAKDKVQLETLRMLKSAIRYVELEAKEELDSEAIMAVISKQVKQRRDSISQYEQAGRTDLVEKEASELAILEKYLPAQMSEAEIKSQAEAVIAELGVTDGKGTGLVMKRLMADLKGQADGKLVSQVVRQLLSG